MRRSLIQSLVLRRVLCQYGLTRPPEQMPPLANPSLTNAHCTPYVLGKWIQAFTIKLTRVIEVYYLPHAPLTLKRLFTSSPLYLVIVKRVEIIAKDRLQVVTSGFLFRSLHLLVTSGRAQYLQYEVQIQELRLATPTIVRLSRPPLFFGCNETEGS